ncbi:PREDICTED: serine protease snake [Nicrophorus vespilloides]|uniref:Serine protease snake n=1 Tax=Nicrophorus vespilloides TaxID=110193 RepID=A0ABM1MQC0_NICVS|nr:PREDICTED: serine protease snake [Nicrophorus vespilloides]
MFRSRYAIAFLLAITSRGYADTTSKDASCDSPDKYCENIWYCKDGSYPDKYTACGHDGLVARVCCDPTYKPTKSRKYCETFFKKMEIDEYGNRDYSSIIPVRSILTENNPHVAALGHRNGSNTEWVCAGSLISNTFILTAAQCLNRNVNIVRLGDLDLNRDDDQVEPQEYGVLRTIVHPEYKAPAIYNDIGLIELNDTVRITKFVKPACLDDDDQLREPTWEETGFNKPDKKEVMASVYLFQVQKPECEKYLDTKRYANLAPKGLDKTQLCASNRDYRFDCQTDIGGPLHHLDFNYVNGKFIIGVISFPKPCNNGTDPGIYTRVNEYAPWIESIVFPN